MDSLRNELDRIHATYRDFIARYIKMTAPGRLTADELKDAYLITLVRLVRRMKDPDFNLDNLQGEMFAFARAAGVDVLRGRWA
jgi:hypothetical protein